MGARRQYERAYRAAREAVREFLIRPTERLCVVLSGPHLLTEVEVVGDWEGKPMVWMWGTMAREMVRTLRARGWVVFVAQGRLGC